MSELSIMDRSGDTKLSWNVGNPTEVAAARAAFESAVQRGGMLAFRVDEGGKTGERIRQFDPEAERIIITPALAGG